jgi:putative hydrolase of the HAD superfamily
MIRALLFDMGNVLIHFSHERMYRQLGELVGRDGSEVERWLHESGLFDGYETGRVTTDELRIELGRLVGRPIDADALDRAASDIFWLNESMAPVIDRLAMNGLPLVLLSNTCETHFRWVSSRYPVLRHFPTRVLSYEVGACKPNAAIFEAAARAAGVSSAECFFTDDTPGHVGAARQLGFDAVVYRDTPQLIADLRMRGLNLA